MKKLLILITVISLTGCHNYIERRQNRESVTDTLYISDTVSPDIIYIYDTVPGETIIIRDTVIGDIVIIHDTVEGRPIIIRDTVAIVPINQYPGLILHYDSLPSDTIGGIWLQWNEGGPWHRYTLNDSIF